MLNAVVLLLFFAMLSLMVLGDKKYAYVWVLACMVLFPPCVYFSQSPQLSPVHVFLYVFFAINLVWNRSDFFDSVFKHPLLVPLVLLFCSLVLTAVLNGEGGKGVYNAVRLYMENYAFLFVAFAGGLAYKEIHIENKWFYPIVIVFVFGVIEFVLKSNLVFPLICKAFPFYDGYFDLTSAVSASRSYRTRIFVTTTHPTVLGSFLCCSLLMLTCRMKQLAWNRGKKWIGWSLLLVLVVMSGSRTALVCALIGLSLFIFMKLSIHVKLILAVIAAFAIVTYTPKIVEEFDVEGQGSSMTLRQEQLLFSYLQFSQSPIYGNGVRYISKYVMERDAYNDRVVDVDIGGLESVIFFQLIDYGLIGICTYIMLFLMMFIYFFRRRRFSHAQAGLLISICFFIFATLSGEIGGNNTFAYMLIGYCMGAARVEEEDEAAENAKGSSDGEDCEKEDAAVVEDEI